VAGESLDSRLLDDLRRPPDSNIRWHFCQAVLTNMRGIGEPALAGPSEEPSFYHLHPTQQVRVFDGPAVPDNRSWTVRGASGCRAPRNSRIPAFPVYTQFVPVPIARSALSPLVTIVYCTICLTIKAARVEKKGCSWGCCPEPLRRFDSRKPGEGVEDGSGAKRSRVHKRRIEPWNSVE
jgi:hypothetical protein